MSTEFPLRRIRTSEESGFHARTAIRNIKVPGSRLCHELGEEVLRRLGRFTDAHALREATPGDPDDPLSVSGYLVTYAVRPAAKLAGTECPNLPPNLWVCVNIEDTLDGETVAGGMWKLDEHTPVRCRSCGHTMGSIVEACRAHGSVRSEHDGLSSSSAARLSRDLRHRAPNWVMGYDSTGLDLDDKLCAALNRFLVPTSPHTWYTPREPVGWVAL